MHVLYCILILINAYISESLENNIVVVQQVCTRFLGCLDINIKIIEVVIELTVLIEDRKFLSIPCCDVRITKLYSRSQLSRTPCIILLTTYV